MGKLGHSRTGLAIAAGLVLVLAADRAAADTFVVTEGGPLTIQQAVDMATTAGDVVEIRKGDYAEAVMITNKDGITIKGKGKPRINAVGIGTAFTLTQSTNITISGIVIVDAETDGIFLGDCTDIMISKVEIQSGNRFGIRAEAADRVTISKCKLADLQDDAINLGGDEENAGDFNPCDDCVVERCRIGETNDDAIEVAGDDNVVQKNKVQDAGRNGITVDPDGNSLRTMILKNKIQDSDDFGVFVNGQDAMVIKNKVLGAGNDGMRLEGAGGHLVEKNTIKNIVGQSADGIDTSDPVANVTIRKNKIIITTADGLDVALMNGTVEGNVIKRAGGHGIRIHEVTTGSTFTKNKTSKSAGVGLRDRTAGGGGNTIAADNKFDGVDDSAP